MSEKERIEIGIIGLGKSFIHLFLPIVLTIEQMEKRKIHTPVIPSHSLFFCTHLGL